MNKRKYFTSNFFINEVFSVEKFPNYGIYIDCMAKLCIKHLFICGGYG